MPPRDVSMMAAALRSTFAEHAAELARVADGGDVTRGTVIAASVIAASAVEVLTALPLTAYWRGYVARWGDDVDRILSVGGAAELETTNTGVR